MLLGFIESEPKDAKSRRLWYNEDARGAPPPGVFSPDGGRHSGLSAMKTPTFINSMWFQEGFQARGGVRYSLWPFTPRRKLYYTTNLAYKT